MDQCHFVLINDDDSDDDLIINQRPAQVLHSVVPSAASASLAVSLPTPVASKTRQPNMQNGARFSGPELPIEAIVSSAISSGIFNVGHTCNVAKRSGSSVMCRIECTKCNSRIILHLKDGCWEVTQSGLCKKRQNRTVFNSPPRVTVHGECCICYADVLPTIACCKNHIFCTKCMESCFTMDVFTLFDKKFGGGGVNVKGAWCSKCVEDCEEKDDVGWLLLRFRPHFCCFIFAFVSI